MSQDSAGQGSEHREIVVAVDGSAASVAALRWALDAADGRSVHAITVWRSEPLFGGPSGQFVSYEQVEKDYVEMLARAVDTATSGRAVPDLRQSVLDGDAAAVLTEAAKDAELLVVGSHGHGRIATSFLGSVSADCVRRATCPVVVMPIGIVREKHVPQPEHRWVPAQTPGPLL